MRASSEVSVSSTPNLRFVLAGLKQGPFGVMLVKGDSRDSLALLQARS